MKSQEKNHFISHVVDGIYITIHNVDKYTYTYSYTNKFNFSKILPLNSIFQDLFNDI